jgi:hypothetical protein
MLAWLNEAGETGRTASVKLIGSVIPQAISKETSLTSVRHSLATYPENPYIIEITAFYPYQPYLAEDYKNQP